VPEPEAFIEALHSVFEVGHGVGGSGVHGAGAASARWGKVRPSARARLTRPL